MKPIKRRRRMGTGKKRKDKQEKSQQNNIDKTPSSVKEAKEEMNAAIRVMQKTFEESAKLSEEITSNWQSLSITWKNTIPLMFLAVFIYLFGVGTHWFYSHEKPSITKECEYTHIKNKKAIVDWIYDKSQHHEVNNFIGMPRRQIEDLIPVIDEGDDPLLVIAVITFESGWNASFTSKANAIGLGGIWEGNEPMLKEAGVIENDLRELYIPEVNIKATQFMITHMRERDDGDIDKCFRFYRGLKRNKNGKADPKDLKELKEYTARILKAYWELKHINSIAKKPIEVKPKETNIKENKNVKIGNN